MTTLRHGDRAVRALLAAGKDGALLRFALGSEYLKLGDARTRASICVRRSPSMPVFGRLEAARPIACAEGRTDEALAAYRDGIVAAERKGDKQAMKEMRFSRGELPSYIHRRRVRRCCIAAMLLPVSPSPIPTPAAFGNNGRGLRRRLTPR
jgi:hypothetical protein